jgi:beta-galactosidase
MAGAARASVGGIGRGGRRKATFAGVLAALALAAAVPAETRAAPAPTTELVTGASWYPEQWPESGWDHDLALMQAAHMKVVRIGEFAWSRMEPREGEFDFAWLDRAIDAAARRGFVVVLGTPTAAPPAWLTQKYPDTLRVDEEGRPAEHGNRQHFSFASARYRQLAVRIADKMAERYGRNPHVIGWQIDNEVGPPSFDPEAKQAFHAWLAARYGRIDQLNAHWATAYWSQTYDSFEQAPMHSQRQNPGLLLDWKRFVSDTWASYVEAQAQAIRAHSAPGQFVTTNTMHWNGGFDHYRMHRNLDLAAWDNYVPTGRIDWALNGAEHDLVRGYKRKNFWVMETQPVFVNWSPVNAPLARGQLREMAWQAVGHGADAVLWWQWRSSPNGQEQYHGSVTGADGEPTTGYDEIGRVGAEFDKARGVLADTSPVAQVALLNSYDSRWAIDFQRHNQAFDPVKQFVSWYGPLRARAQAVDIISADAPLQGYRLVVAPALNVLTPAEAQALEAYVRAGGHLVLGPRSGMKDGFNALWPQRQPGPLSGPLAGRVEQFYALADPAPLSGQWGQGQATIWAEALSAKDPGTKVLMRYGASNGWLDGQPAAITRQVGRGAITYVGAWMDETLTAAMAQDMVAGAGVAPIVPDAPEGVEAALREGGGRRVLILINHLDQPRSVALPQAMDDVLHGGRLWRVELPPHEVAVLAAAAQ